MGLLASLIRPPAERRATPDNPSFGLNDPAAWESFWGGTAADTGESVTPDKALTFSPWWRGVTLIARDVGRLPLCVYRLTRSEQGLDRDLDPAHPAYHLLRWRPNPLQDDLQFKQHLTGHALTRGNGYALVWRSRGAGSPLELLPLDPDRVTPVRANGEAWYVWDAGGTDERKLPGRDVLHLCGFSDDGLAGLPAWEYARQALGLGLAGKKFQARRFARGARPSVVLETPNKMDGRAVERLRGDWERMHEGMDNAHRTAILDNGLTAKPMSASAADTQEAEQLHMTAADVANFLGVPVHKVDPLAPGRTAYASLEQENLSYLTEGLDYWLCAWERQARAKLLTEAERAGESHACEFDRRQLVRGDSRARAEYLRTATGGRAWLTPNEARFEEGLPPSAEEDAGKLLVPLNMGQGGAQNRPADPAADGPGRPEANAAPPAAEVRADPPVPDLSPELLAAVRDGLRDACRRAARRVGVHAVKAAGKPAEFLTWLDAEAGLADHRGALADILGPALRADAAARGEPADVPGAVEALVGDVRASLLEVAGAATAPEFRAAVEAWAQAFEAGWPDAAARATGFDAKQPRDKNGQWTSGGGGGAAGAVAGAGAAVGGAAGHLHGPVVARKKLGGGVNVSEVVTLEGGHKAVWKPAAGEKTGLRANIPDGTAHKREAAIGHAAHVLGLADMVPPTAVREIGGQVGSVQAFVPKARDSVKVTNPFDGHDGVVKAAAFDYVTGQTDRHPGNWMLTDKPGTGLGEKVKRWVGVPTAGEHLRLIDNGLSFPTAETTRDMANQDFLRKAHTAKLPDLSHWEGKRGEFEKSLHASGIEPAAVKLAGDRLDAAVAASKAGKTFGELPYAGGTIGQAIAAQHQGMRVIRRYQEQ